MKNMTKTALVTGANGFTGSNLCRKLAERGYRVIGLVRKSSDLSLLKGILVEMRHADLAVDDSLIDVLRDVDIVFHIAALYRSENPDEKYFFDVNMGGTRKMLDAALRKGVERFVHCSTVGVQGHIQNPPASEQAPYHPGDTYQESKLGGEFLALYYGLTKRMPVTIIRPTGIYGPGDMRFLKLFQHIQNGTFRMIGKGTNFYHMTFIDDLTDGIVLAGEHPQAVGETFTIGGDEYVTLQDLVDKIARVLNRPISSFHIPVMPVYLAGWLCERLCKPFGIAPPLYRRRVDFFIKSRAFDISKAKNLLGYRPQIGLDEGLKRTAQWYREQGWI
jgi:nucleoside-diphosphate-sugar epimerase